MSISPEFVEYLKKNIGGDVHIKKSPGFVKLNKKPVIYVRQTSDTINEVPVDKIKAENVRFILAYQGDDNEQIPKDCVLIKIKNDKLIAIDKNKKEIETNVQLDKNIPIFSRKNALGKYVITMTEAIEYIRRESGLSTAK